MGSNGGLRLGEDSVGVGLIGEREVGEGVDRRRGSAAWASDVEAGGGVCRRLGAWVGDVEAGGGMGRRARSD